MYPNVFQHYLEILIELLGAAALLIHLVK